MPLGSMPSWLVLGIGKVCHDEPGGSVPSTTKLDLSLILVPLESVRLESPANGMGVSWKQASVSLDLLGQRRLVQAASLSNFC